MNNINLKELLTKTKSLVLLYVEDDEDIASKTIDILTELFDTIIYAKNGIEGVEKYKEHPIDLIISAVDMPYLNGFGMLQHIKKLQKNTPAIITTAHTESDYYQEALDLNVQGYILKPVIVDKLLLLIQKIVNEKQIHDSETKQLSTLKLSNEKFINIANILIDEQDDEKLVKSLLLGAKELSNAHLATLYIYNKKEQTLEYFCGVDFKTSPLNIFSNQTINHQNILLTCVKDKTSINIENISKSSSFDFSIHKDFDILNNYKTLSIIVIPIEDKQNEIIGVIQLINKIHDSTVVAFNYDDENILNLLSSFYSMILENKKTKLELVFDKIEIIKAKFEILKKDLEISYLKNEISKSIKDYEISKLENDYEFLNTINYKDKFISEEDMKRLNKILQVSDVDIDNINYEQKR